MIEIDHSPLFFIKYYVQNLDCRVWANIYSRHHYKVCDIPGALCLFLCVCHYLRAFLLTNAGVEDVPCWGCHSSEYIYTFACIIFSRV